MYTAPLQGTRKLHPHLRSPPSRLRRLHSCVSMVASQRRADGRRCAMKTRARACACCVLRSKCAHTRVGVVRARRGRRTRAVDGLRVAVWNVNPSQALQTETLPARRTRINNIRESVNVRPGPCSASTDLRVCRWCTSANMRPPASGQPPLSFLALRPICLAFFSSTYHTQVW